MANEVEEVSRLRARVAELERQLAASGRATKREKIQTMSAEVVDSNPYRSASCSSRPAKPMVGYVW